jgi:hypothetical protein
MWRSNILLIHKPGAATDVKEERRPSSDVPKAAAAESETGQSIMGRREK